MILARRPTDFASRNLFLQVLLGITRVGQRLETFAEARTDEAIDESDPMLLAVLGLFAIRRSVERQRAAALVAPRVRPDERAAASATRREHSVVGRLAR